MAEIHVLDQNTINQIAAGEVVERPASIVKELVENAADAQATAVTIEIKGGGIDFIRITDNGCGIPRDQIKKAFLRHATSKITTAEDLETVASFGFRGEALSSIASVAKVELITKTDEGLFGVRYVTEGGEEVSFEDIGCPEGTTFVVRDLFYNTPARRKFLKSPMTEAGYVESFVQRLALSHPEISFKFISDNKNKIATSGNGNQKDVIYHLFGRDIAANLLEVHYEQNAVVIDGYIGKPSVTRGNRNYENYFVNGRYLKNTVITRGIEDGYKGHAMTRKFPFAVLMIQMDSHYFDVNVHPAKMEMRFKNGEELYSAVVGAVQAAFLKKELIPEVSLGTSGEASPRKAKGAPGAQNLPEPFEKKRREIEKHFSELPKEKVEEICRRKREDRDEPSKDSGALSRERKIESPKAVAAPSSPAPAGVREPIRYASGKQMHLTDTPLLSKEAKNTCRIIGQVFQTYWLAEFEDKLFFVDQHAAHEKVLYEKLKKELQEKRMDQQLVAPPIVLSFSMRERENYLKFQDAFAELGFQIEEFGGDDYCIRAVPANLYGLDQQDLFVELLDGLDEASSHLPLDAVTDKLASMACKAAVKGNQKMSVPEMESLLNQMMELDNPYQCPHGRPTIISMTRYELEKKFQRVT